MAEVGNRRRKQGARGGRGSAPFNANLTLGVSAQSFLVLSVWGCLRWLEWLGC